MRVGGGAGVWLGRGRGIVECMVDLLKWAAEVGVPVQVNSIVLKRGD